MSKYTRRSSSPTPSGVITYTTHEPMMRSSTVPSKSVTRPPTMDLTNPSVSATYAFQPVASSSPGRSPEGGATGPMASTPCASGLTDVGTGMSRAGRWIVPGVSLMTSLRSVCGLRC